MTGQLTDVLSFRRIAGIPFDAYMAELDSWHLTGHGGELRVGGSLLRGPAEHDEYFSLWRIGVRLTRGRLLPPVRMRLEIAPWQAGATALELIPCQRVRPGAAYFAGGDRLLDCLARALPARVPAPRRPDRDCLRAAASAAAPALSRA